MHSFELLLDVQRCFDQADRARFVAIADRVGYPRLGANYSTHMNAMPRRLLWDGDLVRDIIHTCKGFAPGSPFAMWDFYAYMLEACLSFLTRWPYVQLTIHVDDFGVSRSGVYLLAVMQQLVKVWAWIVVEFQEGLPLPFSFEKTNRVSQYTRGRRCPQGAFWSADGGH